jgi:hypothetical protein
LFYLTRSAAQSADESESEDDDSEGAMHFEDPHQLLEVFSQLEEQNLFLIQNCQETEEGLEELKGKFRDTQERMDGEAQNLRDQIEVGFRVFCLG